MRRKKPNNYLYIVISPDKRVEVYATAQEVADNTPFSRNTINGHIIKHDKYDKLGFLIVRRKYPKKDRRGKEIG